MVAVIADQEVVAAAAAAGVGETIEVRLGGKTDRRHGEPLALRASVRLLSDGRFVTRSRMGAGGVTEMGRTAVLQSGGVRVVVTERRVQPLDAELLRSVGIEPQRNGWWRSSRRCTSAAPTRRSPNGSSTSIRRACIVPTSPPTDTGACARPCIRSTGAPSSRGPAPVANWTSLCSGSVPSVGSGRHRFRRGFVTPPSRRQPQAKPVAWPPRYRRRCGPGGRTSRRNRALEALCRGLDEKGHALKVGDLFTAARRPVPGGLSAHENRSSPIRLAEGRATTYAQQRVLGTRSSPLCGRKLLAPMSLRQDSRRPALRLLPSVSTYGAAVVTQNRPDSPPRLGWIQATLEAQRARIRHTSYGVT